MIKQGGLVAALAALTLAAGISGTQAEESCVALDAQVQQIKALTSESALRAKLAELKATGPDCAIIEVAMARLVEIQGDKIPVTRVVAWTPY